MEIMVTVVFVLYVVYASLTYLLKKLLCAFIFLVWWPRCLALLGNGGLYYDVFMSVAHIMAVGSFVGFSIS